MSSILTNTSAMSALQNLAATQKSLSTTQSQISSGLRVATASDNAAYWSIATTMKSDTGALSAVTDALNLGASVVGTATAALNSTITLLNKMKNDVITAQTSGTDPVQVQTDISAQQASLVNIMSSASFNGVNLLDGSTATAFGRLVLLAQRIRFDCRLTDHRHIWHRAELECRCWRFAWRCRQRCHERRGFGRRERQLRRLLRRQ